MNNEGWSKGNSLNRYAIKLESSLPAVIIFKER